MSTIRFRARARRTPDRGRRPRFARLGLAGCFGAGVAALLAAASQNPNRPLLTWSSAPTAAMAAASPAVAVEYPIDPPAGGYLGLALPNARQIFDRFVDQGYLLEQVREDAASVPRLLATSLPSDLPLIGSPDLRKTVFIKMMLPLLQAENERILADRDRILALRDRLVRSDALAGEDLEWLSVIARRYGADNSDIEDLLRRVDAVPPSLAIAQAALETGWGTSRVAQRGNAMFGQMEMRGGREEPPVFAVKTFDDLASAVGAYSLNLNSHRAYAGFRAERAAWRSRGLAADGHELAAHIWRYSERGMDYVRDVQVIIRSNNLRPLDPFRLAG